MNDDEEFPPLKGAIDLAQRIRHERIERIATRVLAARSVNGTQFSASVNYETDLAVEYARELIKKIDALP